MPDHSSLCNDILAKIEDLLTDYEAAGFVLLDAMAGQILSETAEDQERHGRAIQRMNAQRSGLLLVLTIEQTEAAKLGVGRAAFLMLSRGLDRDEQASITFMDALGIGGETP